MDAVDHTKPSVFDGAENIFREGSLMEGNGIPGPESSDEPACVSS
jgi:hypothetical protein